MREMVKEYDAFISYRHCELDMFVAKELHRELEAFRLPKYLARKKNPGEKTRITRVFRDREELPIASNLSVPIEEALRKSEFLIVICTPRLPQSMWCKREIETFINLHGRGRVLAVLAEGEPQESFPEELCYEKITEIDPYGQEQVYLRQVEPLAADVRGASKAEIRKKIKEEVLRLAAPMFSCAYDDIRQRHREQKIKKRLQISTGISAALFVFGAVSFTQAVRIDQQSKVIEAQYQENLKSQSEILATMSQNKWEKGDRYGAIEDALAALPSNVDKPERPLVPEAIYSLTNALRTYDNGTRLQPDCYLEQTSEIRYIASIEDEYLYSVDSRGMVWIWDVPNRKVVTTYQTTYNMGQYANAVQFQGKEAFYMLNSDCVKAYAVQEEKELWTQEIKDGRYLLYDEKSQELLVVSQTGYHLLDAKTGKLLKEEKGTANHATSFIDTVQKSKDGKTYYVAMHIYRGQSDIVTVDASTLKAKPFMSFEQEIAGMKLSADGKSMNYIQNIYNSNVDLGNGKVQGLVVNYSLSNKKKNWEYRISEAVEKVFPISEEKVLVQTYSGLAEVDARNGHELHNVGLGGPITVIYRMENEKLCVLTNAGDVYIEAGDFSFAEFSEQYSVIGDYFLDFLRIQNCYLTLEPFSKKILLYDIKQSEKASLSTLTMEEVEETYGKIEMALYNLETKSEEIGQQAKVDEASQAILFEYLDGGREGGAYACPASFVSKIMYSPDGEVLCIQYSDKQIDFVDTTSFSLVGTVEGVKEIYAMQRIGNNHWGLCSTDAAYIIEKESKCLVAKVYGYLAYDEKANVFYTKARNEIYTISFYSWKELVGIARENLEK